MEINPEEDLKINVSNLGEEFRRFSLVLYRYSQHRAKIDSMRDLAKAKLKEIRAETRKRIKLDKTEKWTENSLEAEIDTDPAVMDAQRSFIRAEHDASTWSGAVESMRAKKDCLIQLGADARKEK